MKKFLILAAVAVLFTSCFRPIGIKEIPAGEHINYVQTSTVTSSYSPVEYYVVKGENPAAAYSWQQITVHCWHPRWFVYYAYQGDKGALISAAFPDADAILTYGGYFYVGKKKAPTEN